MIRSIHGLVGSDWGIRSIDGYAAPDSPENRDAIARFIVTMGSGLCVVGFIAVATMVVAGDAPRGTHPDAALIGYASLVLVVTPLYWFTRQRLPLWSIHGFAVVIVTADALLALSLGSSLSLIGGLGYVATGTAGFVLMRRRVATLYVVFAVAGYGFVVALQAGNTAPVTRWIAVLAATTLPGSTVAWLMQRTQVLASREREAREAAERSSAVTADLNHTLEARVTQQLDELERLGRLRRFLSRQVADTVLTTGGEGLLEPHRQRIAVFCCDLRGFTSFANGAEPEEVVEIIDDYYRTVGDLLRSYDATVGGYAGDGIMAFFNDPVPCDDPAGQAISMALDLRAPMTALIDAWRSKGFSLGYGVGITYGYATLGTIGFDGRHDYTALGSVVNLAARLCSEAAANEILIDQRTFDALRHRPAVEPCTLTVKGFTLPVPAFKVHAASSCSMSMMGEEDAWPTKPRS